MEILQYMTKQRHTSTLHRRDGEHYAACMPVVLAPDRCHKLTVHQGHNAYSAGAKVCRKCFPAGLPFVTDAEIAEAQRLWEENQPLRPASLQASTSAAAYVAVAMASPGPALGMDQADPGTESVSVVDIMGTVGEPLELYATDKAGPSLARWVGQEAQAGRFYGSYQAAKSAWKMAGGPA